MEGFEKVTFRFYDNDLKEYITESLWAKKEQDNYKLDNIPFHAYRYSCDDIVKVEKGEEGLIVLELVKASGNSTFRVLFDDLDLLDQTKNDLENLGYDSEIKRTNKLLAVNVEKKSSYVKLLNYLKKGEDLEKWQYEESCISEHHQDEISNSPERP